MNLERLAAVVVTLIPLVTAIAQCAEKEKNADASAALAGYYVPALAECIAKEK